MKIYTKTGDHGETSLGGGARVSKGSLVIAGVGEIDELNCLIGVCRSLIENSNLTKGPKSAIVKTEYIEAMTSFEKGVLVLERICKRLQKDLWIIGADLASPQNKKIGGKIVPKINGKDIKRVEKWIDGIDEELPALKNFIVPGGTMLAAQLHLARAVCRRAERVVIKLADRQKNEIGAGGDKVLRPKNISPPEILIYLNRLSDLLFMMARYANKIMGEKEEKVGD